MNQANPIPAAPKPRKPRAKKTSPETATETIHAVAAPSSETLLHVDLWADKTPDTFQPIAAQMISDLILGTGGTLQSSTESGLFASYRSTRQAIAAVRNLCLLIDGFSTTGNATIHAAFTLCYAGDLEHRSSPPTEPQRVLLIGAVCDVARTIPGLRFRELSPNAKAPHCATLELLTPAHHQRSRHSASSPAPAALATASKPRRGSRTPNASRSFQSARRQWPAQPQPAPNPKRRMQIFAAVGAVSSGCRHCLHLHPPDTGEIAAGDQRRLPPPVASRYPSRAHPQPTPPHPWSPRRNHPRNPTSSLRLHRQ